MRLLITGSRMWCYPQAIRRVIEAVLGHAFHVGRLPLTVVHGRAKGADFIASNVVRRMHELGMPIYEDPYPADWTGTCASGCPPGHRRTNARSRPQSYCPTAGHRRNQHMVDTLDPAVDLAAAFQRDGSTGTEDCLQRIRSARIPHLLVPWERRNQLDIGFTVDGEPDLLTLLDERGS